MDIAIIGGGIGGLSAYEAIRKYLPENTRITVYESHLQSTSVGGGLGLAPNAMSALSALSARAAEHCSKNGLNCAIITFRNSLGTLLGEYWNGTKARYGFSQVLLPRHVVHEALLLNIPSKDIQWGRRVTGIKELDDGVQIVFEDGSLQSADIVVAADGVRSVVRNILSGASSHAKYDGYTGVGGFLPSRALSPHLRLGLAKHPITMTFGAESFFGYSLVSDTTTEDPELVSNRLMWWSTYKVDTPPTHQNTQLSSIHQQLSSIHGEWTSPHDSDEFRVFESILELGCGPKANINDLLILPRYISPALDRWTSEKGRIFLIGDAAHALPPDAGQGVACAIEDAVALALLLGQIDDGSSEALQEVANSYETIRMPRVAAILAVAQRRSGSKKNKGWWAQFVRDWMLWLLCKLPEKINDRIFAYDIVEEVVRYTASKKSKQLA